MNHLFTRLIMVALLTCAAIPARADVIVQNTGGSRLTFDEYEGESFKTPSDFLYHNITFNFYSDVPATTPAAAGTAFLLSQAYAGTPGGLSMTTPGFLTASTSATGGVFAFNPNFVLLTNTTYYLYANANLIISGSNTFANSLLYFAASATSNFTPTAALANFSLNGTRVGTPLVPEPSSKTALYVLSGVVGLGFVVMRRRRTLA